MVESLKLIQLRCPNCGSTLSRANRFETRIKCPYCSNVIEVAETKQQALNVAAPERLILFKTTEQDFEQTVCNRLLGEGSHCIPGDIFDKIEMDNATAVYLPMYLFEGKFETNYNCDVGEVYKSDDGKPYTSWRPHTGTAKSNYAVLCLAFEGQEITPELAEWTQWFPYDPTSAQPFDAELVTEEGYQILPHNLDRETTWHKWGTNRIKIMAEEEAKSQLPGTYYRDFNASYSYDIKHEGRLILVPFWFVYYTYENQQYYVLMDGMGEYNYATIPDCPKLIKINKKWEKHKKWASWIAWLAAVPLFIYLPRFIESGFWWFVVKSGIAIVTWTIVSNLWNSYTTKKGQTPFIQAYNSRKKAYDNIVSNNPAGSLKAPSSLGNMISLLLLFCMVGFFTFGSVTGMFDNLPAAKSAAMNNIRDGINWDKGHVIATETLSEKKAAVEEFIASKHSYRMEGDMMYIYYSNATTFKRFSTHVEMSYNADFEVYKFTFKSREIDYDAFKDKHLAPFHVLKNGVYYIIKENDTEWILYDNEGKKQATAASKNNTLYTNLKTHTMEKMINTGIMINENGAKQIKNLNCRDGNYFYRMYSHHEKDAAYTSVTLKTYHDRPLQYKCYDKPKATGMTFDFSIDYFYNKIPEDNPSLSDWNE